MKKILIVTLVLAGLATLGVAVGLQTIGAGMFYAQSASTNSTAIIMPQNGQIALVNLSATCDTNQLTAVIKYPASIRTFTTNAATTATVMQVQCDAAGTVGGHTMATGDVVIAVSAGTPTLFTVVNPGTIKTNDAARNDYVLFLTNSASSTLAAKSAVYVVSSNQIVSATQTTNVLNALYQGISQPRMPIAIKAVGTGSTSINGYYEVWQ